MRRVIETGLKKPPAPHAWAIASNDTLYSVHVPIRPDGSIENGDATQQTEVTLADLQATLKAAGADLCLSPLKLGHYFAASEESMRWPGSVIRTKIS